MSIWIYCDLENFGILILSAKIIILNKNEIKFRFIYENKNTLNLMS